MSIYRERADVSRADVARLRQQLGLDDPIPVQYLRWLGNLARGDWGDSLVTNEPVITRIAQRLPATLLLMGSAFILTLVIAVPWACSPPSASTRGSTIWPQASLFSA